jgi:hypothetical protein
MRLILVHGINNQENSPQEIKDQWLGAIRKGWEKLGLAAKPMDDVITAYYAQDLAEASNQGSQAIAMGDPAAAGGEADTAYQFLREYQIAAGITDEEVQIVAARNGVSVESVGLGPPHEGWVIALAVALEALLPSKGKYIAGIFLKQAAVYLDRRAVTQRIDGIVERQVFPQNDVRRSIILAHSLGTVITYRLLTGNPPPEFSAPLYITMGSPLGIKIVKARLPVRAAFPRPPIDRWLNAVCKDDFVTLNKKLKNEQLGYDGVEHDGNVPNAGSDKHAIEPYLEAPGVAKAIHDALG